MHPSYLRFLATPDRKSTCATSLLLPSCASVAPHKGLDKTPGPQPGIGALNCVRLSIQRMAEVVHHSSTVSVIGLARWMFCMVGSACRLPPAIRPRRIPLLGSYLHAMLSCHRRGRVEAKVDGLAVPSGRRQPA